MKVASIIIVLNIFSICTMVAGETLSPFGEAAYKLFRTSGLFDTAFAIPDKSELEYNNAAQLFMDNFGIPHSVYLDKVSSEAKDNFSGKMTPYENFKAEADSAEYYLQRKGLLTPENNEAFADMFFKAYKNVFDSVGTVNQPLSSRYLMLQADIDFYKSLGEMSVDEGFDLMSKYTDILHNISHS